MSTRWFVVVLLLGMSGFAWGQAAPKTNKSAVGSNRSTLGTPKPMPAKVPLRGPRIPVERPSVGTPAQVLAQASAARSNKWISDQVADSLSEGTLTLFNVEGPQGTFNVSLLRKGDRQVQRIIKQNGKELRQGSDGSASWSSLDGMTSNDIGGPQHFVESLTDRSFQSLFKAGVEIHDIGMKGDSRVLEVFEKADKPAQDDRKTRYFIDSGSSTVSRIEMVTGEYFDTFFNRKMEVTESVVFSDYRDVGGVMTPFKIESLLNGIKTEEMQFKTVSHNQSLQDRAFRP